MLSKNQIYNRFVKPHKTISFANWLTVEQKWYDENNKDVDYKFDQWLNDKYENKQSYWCAEGENTSWWDKNKDSVLNSLGGLLGGNKQPEAPAADEKEADDNKPAAKGKYIFGLPKPVFYTGVVVTVAALAYIGYRVFRTPKTA